MSNKNSKISKYLIYTSIVILAITWLYAFFYYSVLPDKIVAHMDLQGNVNRYDDKSMIWILLIVFTGLSYGIYWLSNQKFPEPRREFKDKTKNRIITLMSLPYLALVSFCLVFVMIQKTINPSFESINIMIVMLTLTIILLVAIFTFTYKNLKS